VKWVNFGETYKIYPPPPPCVHVLKSTVKCYYIASILKIMCIYKTVYSIYPFSMFTNIIRIFKMKNFLTVEINTH